MSPQPPRDTTAGRVYNDLRNLARRQGRPTDELFQLYVLERFLYRLSRSPVRDRLVLKGLRVRMHDHGVLSRRLVDRQPQVVVDEVQVADGGLDARVAEEALDAVELSGNTGMVVEEQRS